MLTVTREGNKKRRTIVVPMEEIPVAPNIIARGHWKMRKMEVDRWTLAVAAVLDPFERHALRKNARKEKPSIVRIFAILLHRRKAFDPDNAVGALKFIIDGMVRARLLHNDTNAHVKIEEPSQGERCGPGTILCLTWTE